MSGLRIRVLTVPEFEARRVPGAPPVLLAADPNSRMPSAMMACVLEAWDPQADPYVSRAGTNESGAWAEVPVIQVEEPPVCG